MRRSHFVIFLLLLCHIAGAQSSVPLKKQQEMKKYGSTGTMLVPKTVGRTGGVAGKEMGFGALPVDNAAFPDKRMKAIGKQMEDRQWEEENTAWQAALNAGTKEAFQKYIAKYPNGAHIADAQSRIVDLNVKEVFKSKHNSLPQLRQVNEDPDSPASTVLIRNETGMMLTVMFSGTDSKSVVIPPGMSESVTVTNGVYKIAASVPSPSIRPFAGESTLTGGSYETGFWIVRGY